MDNTLTDSMACSHIVYTVLNCKTLVLKASVKHLLQKAMISVSKLSHRSAKKQVKQFAIFKSRIFTLYC